MSLDQPPPSRYRIEEKDGRLIVHDSMASVRVSSTAPGAQPRSALDAIGRTLPAAPQPARPSIADSGKAKRSATVVAIGLFLALFLIFTGLWPVMAIALIIAPARRQLLGHVLPAVKRYVEEGRFG
ncbi:MAG: hypothetical protein ABIM50_06110 [Novosphingobium sp.]